MNFIEAFLDYTKEFESPTSFWQWSAVAMLSATMRDNVQLKWGKMTIYPNLYIMLLADSGACRKGMPIIMANKFLSEVDNTKLIVGRSSIQGVIQELANVETTKMGPIVKKGACGFQLAEEYAASFVGDPAVVQILTDIYDYKERYPVRLRDSVTELKNVCFGFFVATNSTMLQQLYDNNAIEGGLVGRIFIINERKRRQKNSMVRAAKDTGEAKIKLIEHLKVLSKIKGEALYEESAIDLYDEWYNSFDDDEDHHDKTGFIWRVHTGVAKLSLCLAAAEDTIHSGSIIVKRKHVEEAISLAFKVKQNQNLLSLNQGHNPMAQQIAILFKALGSAEGYQLSRRDLMKKHWCDFDHLTLDNIITTLEAGGVIRTTSVLGEVGYQLTEKTIRELFKNETQQETKINTRKVSGA